MASTPVNELGKQRKVKILKQRTWYEASNGGWMRCPETENLVALNQYCATTSEDCNDLYNLKSSPPMNDLSLSMPMPCSCLYNDPILPYQLQKEKRNLWEPSPAQMYCMITMLIRLENGECLTTVLDWGNQFIHNWDHPPPYHIHVIPWDTIVINHSYSIRRKTQINVL
ncbi:hypothetical protein NE237_000133 [Protea cynaroides]|uniref:Uncharacterized protein n=1 Tax=Protea cynaroides TaxID=273540 RepID=A0A9Q0GPA4_9MAGN|nr:hypothetical protein NE237_000133 [Protea cynaroides]